MNPLTEDERKVLDKLLKEREKEIQKKEPGFISDTLFAIKHIGTKSIDFVKDKTKDARAAIHEAAEKERPSEEERAKEEAIKNFLNKAKGK